MKVRIEEIFIAFDSEGSKTYFKFSFHVDLDHFRVIYVPLGTPIGPKRTIEGSDGGNIYCIRFRKVENLYENLFLTLNSGNW